MMSTEQQDLIAAQTLLAIECCIASWRSPADLLVTKLAVYHGDVLIYSHNQNLNK
jgi:hypothetical protein